MKNIFDRVKLFFGKDKEFRSALYNIMGFYPHNIELYRVAFAHKSQEYRSKKTGNKPLNNERLEFLGDAVLETVVSHIVYHHFKNKREGFLTNTRSKIVSRESLGRLAKELGIDRLIQSQTHSRSHNSYIGGNSFEALMGAIYLDRGFSYAFRFVEKRIIGAVLDLEGVANKEVNFKSKILEWSQKNRIRLDFKDSHNGSTQGNNPAFQTTVIIEGIWAGEGKGFSKKESHQNAAKDALTQLRREEDLIDRVLRSKEKRTAMEAGEFFVLPKIDEIEAEIANERAQAGERRRKDKAKDRQDQRPERKERNKRNEAKEAKNEPKADKQPEAKRERQEPKPERAEQKTERQEPKAERADQKSERAEQKPKQEAAPRAERKERPQRQPRAEQAAAVAVTAVASEKTTAEPEAPATDEMTTNVAPAPAPAESIVAQPEAVAVAPEVEAPVAEVAAPAAEMVETKPEVVETQSEVAETKPEVVEDKPEVVEAPAAPLEKPAQSAEVAAEIAPAPAEEAPAPIAADEQPTADESDETEDAADDTQAQTQRKRKSRRKGKRQQATEFANTTPPPAEQSHRAEKAKRREQEAKAEREAQKARATLDEQPADNVEKIADPADAPAPATPQPAPEATTASDEQPKQRRRNNRNNRQRRKAFESQNNDAPEASAEERKEQQAQIDAAFDQAYGDN